jgi:hypothetical protein
LAVLSVWAQSHPGPSLAGVADEAGAGSVSSISRTVRIASERRSVQVEIPHTTAQPIKVKKISVSIPGNFIRTVLSRLTDFEGKVMPSTIQINTFFGYLLIRHESYLPVGMVLKGLLNEIRVFIRIFPYF